jgi:hypothetical protein
MPHAKRVDTLVAEKFDDLYFDQIFYNQCLAFSAVCM